VALLSPACFNLILKQAGAELCQARAQVGLPAEAEQILKLSSMEADFHLIKIVLDSTRVDLQMLQSNGHSFPAISLLWERISFSHHEPTQRLRLYNTFANAQYNQSTTIYIFRFSFLRVFQPVCGVWCVSSWELDKVDKLHFQL
jgi:hypothetical protein